MDLMATQGYQGQIDKLVKDYYQNLQGYLPYELGFATGFPPVGQQITGEASSSAGISPLLEAFAYMNPFGWGD
jgi:hypothetical protein